jgi:hypothetical protein
MVYISGGRIVAGPPPPPLLYTLAHHLYQALRRRPWLYAAAALLLACAASAALEARAAAALLLPTLAHSRPLDAASDAAIARDTMFAHTFSRAKPQTRAATWAGLLGSWRARLAALGDRSGEMRKALPQHYTRARQGDAREWAMFGEDLGDVWNLDHAGFTRCAQAAFAVETYLCGSAASVALHTPGLGPYLYETGVAALAEAVQRATALGASLVLDVTLNDADDDTFGHHFAVRVAPAAGVKLYMSYIGHYTLGKYLSRHPVPLDAAQWEAALVHLRTLEAASGNWSAQAEDAYHALFDVRLDKKKSAGAIRLAHAAACVVPPYNGTRADPFAEGHAERVSQLLQPPLQASSRYAAVGAEEGAGESEAEGGLQQQALEEEYF